jgi:hypothetical protein
VNECGKALQEIPGNLIAFDVLRLDLSYSLETIDGVSTPAGLILMQMLQLHLLRFCKLSSAW